MKGARSALGVGNREIARAAAVPSSRGVAPWVPGSCSGGHGTDLDLWHARHRGLWAALLLAMRQVCKGSRKHRSDYTPRLLVKEMCWADKHSLTKLRFEDGGPSNCKGSRRSNSGSAAPMDWNTSKGACHCAPRPVLPLLPDAAIKAARDAPGRPPSRLSRTSPSR